MKKLFYFALIGILLFEFLKVYFIMPMPGSQTMNSIDLAYFLHTYRWIFRGIFIGLIIAGGISTFKGDKWVPAATLALIAAIVFVLNFKMSADKMFQQVEHLVLKSQSENKIPLSRIVIGVTNNGEAKAYPIEFLTYHHQVQDSIGGKPILVTYCSVCRTGRVFEPKVNGQYEKFRLVGMDHFNATFEDATTGSWWRQVTGDAIAGKLKGEMLPELESRQMSLEKWFQLYPDSKVMQADEAFIAVYDSLARFEQGKSKSKLTGTDSLSWKNKSWVVGIQIGNAAKAYDWNDLKKQGIINDSLGKISIVLAISSDGRSFAAFEKPANKIFTIRQDTLLSEGVKYNFAGQDVSVPSNQLKAVNAYQEFWHSWATFHPETERYVAKKVL